MATLRSGSGLPSRPNEGTRTRTLGETRLPQNPPRTSSRTAKKEMEAMKATQTQFFQPRQSSRVPQPSVKQPSVPQPTSRTTLRYQSHSSTASGSTASSRLRSSTRGGSGSSSSSQSFDSIARPGPNVLRRKKSSLSGDVSSARDEASRTSSSSSLPRSRLSLDPALGIHLHLDRSITASPAEIQVAEVVEIQKASVKSPRLYPELDRYRDIRRPSDASDLGFEVPFRLATHDLPPLTPASLLLSGTSGSPSTRFSESPGPGSFSRDTTPTSICSQSPGLVASFRANQTKLRLNSPLETRPPVTRRRAGSFTNEVDSISVDPHGLAAVRESLASSSSNSTVREADRSKDKKLTKRLPPPPPSPPPRKSSQKFRQTREHVPSPPPKPSRKPSRPPVTSPHLESNVKSASSRPVTSPRATPPSRPSRDGTPDIQSQLFSPLPIIHSNLSTNSLPYERRGSEPSITQSSLPKSSGQFYRSDRNASTSRLPIGGDSALKSQNVTAADAKKPPTKTEPPRTVRTPSPHIGSTFNSRFLFFGRKKTVDVAQVEKDKNKAVRKGPAAGTGHEGYGRPGAIRRRSGSINNFSRGSPGSQSSQDSLASHDPFLADRINPVIIAGGEIIENRNTSSDLSRTESNQSISFDQPKRKYDLPAASHQGSRNTLWPSAMERTPYPPSAFRRPSDSSDSEGVTMKPTLALRRSAHRLRSSPDNPLRLPQPINTSGSTSSPMTSFDTSIMSDESHVELQREVIKEKNLAHPAPKKLTKRARSPRKWNLFSRSQSQPESNKNEKVAATVKAVEKKPVAFYMMDSSEQEDSETLDVQEVLRRANVYGDLPSPEKSAQTQRPEQLSPEAPPQKKSGLLPRSSPVQRAPDNTRQHVAAKPVVKAKASPPAAGILSSGRPSRLPQVGRIPKVISKRPEQASPKSFSRPFRASLQLPPRAPNLHDVESIAKGPTPPKPSSPVPDLTMEGSTIGSGTNISPSYESIPESSPERPRIPQKEFISFSPRKNSEGTIGTSSSSCSGLYAFADATAIIPNPLDPPAEDEVWDEYDDLLGEDNQKAPVSASSSKGIPFHLETYQSRLAKEKPMESPTIVFDERKVSTYSKATTRSSNYSVEMTERIRTHFQPHPSPSNSFSVSEFVSGYGKRESSVETPPKPRQPRQSSHSSRNERNSDASSNSDEGSPLAQVNLRVGSMTVSKWLTFGHVLFSDVRHDLVPVEGSLKRPSILVIDGLGNDDWSFYAAETYPAATFFNLSPRAPLPTDLKTSPSSFPLSPPNHHQIQYVSHFEKFPFAPQSFTAVVYRFPVAAPESYYRNILTEARRVLKPGGFIELSILDVDLNNMGNRGRRTVRSLKENINGTTPDTSLASTADLILRLLGKVGFMNIKAARVGVPVASSATHHDSQRKGSIPEAGQRKKNQPSLAEMMRDNGPLADEGITKMVSRVGRWWYTRCYESAMESPGGKSIWKDKSLLRECEDLGTSLKLMVCCARAPDRIPSF